MTITAAERSAMQRALAIAATAGVPLGPNPRVGCVLLDPVGVVIAEGFHHGAGTAHAEAAALAEAGRSAHGATAVITLEPCNHTGRTGPCTEALISAGIRRVIVAMPDPNPVASGGIQRLQAAGVEIEQGLLAAQSWKLNREWLFGLDHGRPFVTWKFATTLDGFSAAADGSSRWVSSRPARQDVHRLRARCDVVLAGTGTIEFDDPELTVRTDLDRPAAHQPLRALMGLREIPGTHRIFNGVADTVKLRTRDPHAALRQLFEAGRRHVLLEGGPTLAAAFLQAGLIDEVITYVAPKLLGAGRSTVGDLGIESIDQACEFEVLETVTVGQGAETNVRITLQPRKAH